jgi:hypothetical protein
MFDENAALDEGAIDEFCKRMRVRLAAEVSA